MKETLVNPKNKCLRCNSSLKYTTDAFGEDIPSVGDYTVCSYCGTLHQFGIGLSLYLPDRKTVPRDLKRKVASLKKRLKKLQ